MKKTNIIILIIAFTIFLTGCGNKAIETSKKPFPDFTGTDFNDNPIDNSLFSEYKATVINFWSNNCGSCIEEMPELQDYADKFIDDDILLIGVATSAGESEDMRAEAQNILNTKEVEYANLIPDNDSDFYNEFISSITGYPITYIIDSQGNIIGAPIVGVVEKQEDVLLNRLSKILGKDIE